MKLKFPHLLLCSLIALTGCGKKSEKKPTHFVDVKTYFIKGDPESLIEGTTRDKTSFITRQNLLTFNEFEFNSMSLFTEKEEIIKRKDVTPPPTDGGTKPGETVVTTEELEAGNEAEDTNRLEYRPTFYNFKNDGRTFSYENPQNPLSLKFRFKDQLLQLEEVAVNGVSIPVTVLHYSLKRNKDAFSILIKVQDNAGKNLISMTFVRKSNQTIDLTDKLYRYIAGPGVKVKWDGDPAVDVNICGTTSTQVLRSYYEGLLLWKDALKGNLQLSVGYLAKYPPFSDLNVHCIYMVKNYLTHENKEIMNTASTMPIMDRFKGRFADSDIIVWAKEIEKAGTTPEDMVSLGQVIGHEFGHFLGLDHQFDDSIQSIMSYDGVMEVTPYDRDAIKALYGR